MKLGTGAKLKSYVDSVKDYNLAKATAVVDDVPISFLPDYSMLPVYMQGKTPTCGAHAWAFFKCVQEYLETGNVQDFSRRFPWINIKMIDGYPINLDTGQVLTRVQRQVPWLRDRYSRTGG